MQLLDLATGAVSLEFSPKEKPEVMVRLRQFGRVSLRREATYDVLSIGGEQLTYVDEWDEPCLIAETTGGKALLVAVARGSASLVAAE